MSLPMITNGERIRDVRGYEGKYAITSSGRLWSYRRRMFLSASKTNRYKTITLYDKGRDKNVSIHRLVADAFIDNIENKNYVNHKDGDKHNNNVSNLEWVTPSENDIHAFKNGLRKPSDKQRAIARINAKTMCHTTRKKTYQKTIKGDIVNIYKSIREAAREMGVTHQAIMAAVKNNNLSCGFKWEVA